MVTRKNAAQTAAVAAAESTKVVKIRTVDLQFDPDNPRFYRLNDASNVGDVIEEMLDKEGAQNLMLSIGQKGYFEGEPLLVVSNDGQAPFTVVEGNRRLAAVKLLNGEIPPPTRRRSSINQIRAEAASQNFPTILPCLVYRNRRDVLRYLGYRHITGIQEWDALSKARYLADLRDEFYQGQNQPQQMKALANDIGSRSDYVAQLLTALNLYVAAEDGGRFMGLPIEAKDVEFSYITTALNYSSICEWLGLDSKGDVDMAGLVTENLKKAFGWFFSKDQLGRTVLGETRNLAQLAAVVRSETAIQVLTDSNKLSEAYLYSDGPQQALQNAMEQALERITTVWRMVPGIEDVSQEHSDLARRMQDNTKLVKSAIDAKLEL